MKKSQIEHIASLAKLRLTDSEIAKFAEDLAPVLKHFEDLKAVDTEGVEPLITPSEIEYWMREDEVAPSLPAEEAVANAPERAGNLFKVPPVV